jgi:RecB family exonuclease
MVLHEVFESFFERWTQASRGAISPATLGDARALMAEVADEVLGRVAPEDREIERARLLGSPTSIGFAEQVFRAEVERGGTVLERLLEHRLDGEYVLEGSDGPRPIMLRGVADRIDVLDNGELRIYDYKSSRAPHTKTRLQLPVYAWCAEQQLDGRRGRAWRVSDAAYLAAKAADGVTTAFEGLDKRDAVIGEGLARLVASVEGIERGSFTVDPVEQHACTFCPYPTVCRKDDLGDE